LWALVDPDDPWVLSGRDPMLAEKRNFSIVVIEFILPVGLDPA
jgi:hypothetical protein